MGLQARAVSVAVEGEIPDGKFGIGHPAYPLARAGAWKGHACCLIGDVLVDPTISNIRRVGIEAPLMVAVRTERPWHPAASLALAAGVRLTWPPSDVDLNAHPDLRSPLRAPATERAAAALARYLASHAIAMTGAPATTAPAAVAR